MAIVSEHGQVTKTGKSKLRAVPKEREAMTTKASGPKPPKAGKEKELKDATRCDLCGATDKPVRYIDGNAACETCAQTAQPAATAPAGSAKTKRAPKAKTEGATTDATDSAATPKAGDVVVPRSMAALAESYARKLESDGHTPSTRMGYSNDFALAVRELGPTTLVADLTPKQVAAYFRSDSVLKLRSGGAKSGLSVAKTIRVAKFALDHAVELGWIPASPVPQPSKT